MPSTGSSISLCDAVCSCLISSTRHSDFFPGSRSCSGSRAPFQTQHPLEPSFENQLSLHSFRCLCRAFPSQLERWEHQDVDGKTHPTNTRLPEETSPSSEVERRKKILIPPCHGAAAPPPSSPMAAALCGAFEAFFLPLPPPTHRRSRSGHAVGWWGPRHAAAASPAPRARSLAPLLAQSWRRGSFARFGRVSRRLSAGVPTALPSGSAAAEPVQPVRPTACGERRAGHSQGRLGSSSSKLRLQGTWPGPHSCSVAELAAACTAWGRSGAGKVARHRCHQGKPSGLTEPDTIRILPKASLGSALQPDQEQHLEYLRVWDKPRSVTAVKRRMVLLHKGGWHTGLAA